MITDKFLFGYNRDSKFLFTQQKGMHYHKYIYICISALLP